MEDSEMWNHKCVLIRQANYVFPIHQMLLTENILKWIDPFIRLLHIYVCVYDIDVDVQLKLSSSLFH